MDFPIELKNSIEEITNNISISEMKKISNEITFRYKEKSGSDSRLITNEKEAVVYSAVRMPATFGAVSKALEYSLECADFSIESVLDVGAGTGAVAWACEYLCSPKKITCMEREKAMADLGSKLMNDYINAEWTMGNFVTDELPCHADLVTASYALNELSEQNRFKTITKLWNAADKMLLIIEPGTPEGYRQIRSYADFLKDKGAFIIAPCTHQEKCRIDSNDWCHFSVRVARNKLHKLLKSGDVPYEDEKFCFIAFSKTPAAHNDKMGRVLRKPIINKGFIELSLCMNDKNDTLKITKKDGDIFKKARKSGSGDLIKVKK